MAPPPAAPLRLDTALLHRAARRPGALLAIEGAGPGERRWTFADGAAFVERFAGALAGLGIAPGERIAVLSRNSAAYPLFFLAAWRAGAVPVPLNYRLSPPELGALLADSGARLVVAEPGHAEAIEAQRDGLPALAHCIASEGTATGWRALDDVLAAAHPRARPAAHAPTDTATGDGARGPACRGGEGAATALLLYTSGTSGRAKGVVVSQRALAALLGQWRHVYPLAPGDRQLLCMPMYHVGGLYKAFHAIGCGAANRIERAFDPERTVRQLDEEGIAKTTLAPTMVADCLGVAGVGARRYQRLRLLTYGGGPVTPAVLERALGIFGCDFIQSFGMTELPTLSFLMPRDHRRALAEPGAERLLSSAGRAAPGCEIEVVDPDGARLGPGASGEIRGRAAHVMDGYWRQPEASARALRDGWMHTGDGGLLDDEGFLFVRDRIKDVIVSGGENISAREVEQALATHPAVHEVAVIGVPDARWGESVHAVVVATEPFRARIATPGGADALATALCAHCRDRIAGYKRPRSFAFVDALPRNPSGKVLKRELRRRASAPGPQ